MAEPTLNDIRKVLGSHGHAFQYAVLRRAQELFDKGRSTWVFDVAEFPVEGTDKPIHIDFILSNRSNNVYLVIECKRVDPAVGNWCFLKLPYTRRDADEASWCSKRFNTGLPTPSVRDLELNMPLLNALTSGLSFVRTRRAKA